VQRLDRALCALLWLIAAWLAAESWGLTVDDAYIVARYADNAAQHGQLAFNLGEPAVEGVTSPALLAVAWLAAVVGADPIVALKLFGAAGLVAAALAMLALVEELRLAAPARSVSAAYFLSPEVGTFASAGLETAPFIALCLGLLWALARAVKDPQRGFALGIVAGSAVAVRPEGVVVGAIVWLVWALPRWSSHRRIVLRAAIAWLAPIVGVTAIRLALFGTLLPNTYYAKMGGGFDPTFLHGLAAVIGVELWDLVVIAVGIVVTTRLVSPDVQAPDRRSREVAVAAMASVAVIAAAYCRHALVMNYAHRFQHHLVPLLWAAAMPLVGWAGRSLAWWWRATNGRRRAAWGVALALAAVASGCTRRRPVAEGQAKYRAHYRHVMDHDSAGVATWVREHLPEDAVIACYPDAGLVPYRSGRRAIDFGRINDATLARTSIAESDYFFAREPEVLIVWSRSATRLWSPQAQALVDDARFSASYEQATLIGNADSGMGYRIYRRRR
jgi:arabinofuranosyltransferase